MGDSNKPAQRRALLKGAGLLRIAMGEEGNCLGRWWRKEKLEVGFMASKWDIVVREHVSYLLPCDALSLWKVAAEVFYFTESSPRTWV